MGNQQSAEESAAVRRRPPTKLTKPRTNSSTPNLLLSGSTASQQGSKIELPLPPTRRASMLNLDNPDERPQGAKAETKHKRRSLFRFKTAQAAPMDEQNKEKDLDAWMAPLHRYSSLGNLTYEPFGDAQVLHESRPVARSTRTAPIIPYSQPPSRLSEIVEARSPDRRTARQGEVDEDHEDDASLADPERSNSDPSINIPIRRRSLQTPGIATRQSSRDDPYRISLPAQLSLESFNQVPPMPTKKPLPSQESPSQEELRNYYYDSSKPVDSPLEELAALETRRLSLMQPRTHTPNEMDYAHIGSFKLGSLRITNGAASPVPSAMETKTIDSKDDDYSTCSEGRTSEENPYRKTYDSETLRNFASEFSPQQNPPNPRKLFAETRSNSPLRQRLDIVDNTVTTAVHIPDKSLELFKFNEVASSVTLKSPTRARELAETYMQDIASSPFSFEDSAPPSPHLEATSKATAADDNLFEDELDSGISLSAKLSRPDLLQFAMSGVDMPDSLPRSRTKTVQGRDCDAKPKPLEKADSGYSSNASLRSLKQRRSWNEGVLADMNAPGLPEKIPPDPPAKEKRHTFMNFPKQKSFPDHAPPTPPKDRLSNNRINNADDNSSFFEDQTAQSPPPSRVPPTVPLKSSSNESPRTHQTPEQKWAAAQAKAQVLVIPKAQMPRNLQRQSMPLRTDSDEIFQQFKRPDSITVQGSDDVHSREIPPIPQHASRALEDRIKQYPTPIHTYNKNKSVRRSDSKETLATIMSMASAEQQAEETHRYDSLAKIYQSLPPGHAKSQNGNKENENSAEVYAKTNSRSVTPQISRQQTAESLAHSNPGSSSRGRNPAPRSGGAQSTFENHITSLGSASAANASRYDAPVGTTSSPRSPELATVTPMKMKRSTIGMDSPAASQFARERSKQRALSRRASWDRPVTQTPDTNGYSSSPPVPSIPIDLANQSPASRLKRTKPPPPVSLRGNGAGSVGRKGPPPPAWASLSAAARDKMNQVFDSPPESPMSPILGPKGVKSPSPAPRLAPLPKPAMTEQRLIEEQLAAQQRGWAARRNNAAEPVNRRKSVEFEVQKNQERIALSQLPQGVVKAPPQSYFPPQKMNARSNTTNTTTAPTVTTTTTSSHGKGYGSLNARKSWDTITVTSTRGPSSNYSTYTESVYSNAPGIRSSSGTTVTSTHSQNEPQSQRGLARAQSYNLLVDHSGSYNSTFDAENPSSRRNSLDRSGNANSAAPMAALGMGSIASNWAPAAVVENNYSNANVRGLVQRQVSNGSLKGANDSGGAYHPVQAIQRRMSNGTLDGSSNGSAYFPAMQRQVSNRSLNGSLNGTAYRGPIQRQFSNGSMNGSLNGSTYRQPMQRQASNGSLNGSTSRYRPVPQRQVSNGSLNGTFNASPYHPSMQRQISNDSLKGNANGSYRSPAPPLSYQPPSHVMQMQTQTHIPRWDEYSSYMGYDGGYAAAAIPVGRTGAPNGMAVGGGGAYHGGYGFGYEGE